MHDFLELDARLTTIIRQNGYAVSQNEYYVGNTVGVAPAFAPQDSVCRGICLIGFSSQIKASELPMLGAAALPSLFYLQTDGAGGEAASNCFLKSAIACSAWYSIGPWSQCPLWVKSRHLQRKKACPLYPQKRTCAMQRAMSAKGQEQTHAAQQGRR